MIVLLKLTRPDGVPVWLRADSIIRISHALDREDALTTIGAGEVIQDVKETVEEVVQMVVEATGEKSQ